MKLRIPQWGWPCRTPDAPYGKPIAWWPPPVAA